MFFLKPIDRRLRVEFCKFMRDNNIGPEQLFYTDENIFPLCSYINRGTNKIRISKKTKKNLKREMQEPLIW